MRRRRPAAAALLVLALLTAACSKGDEADVTTKDGKASDGEPTSSTTSAGGGDGPETGVTGDGAAGGGAAGAPGGAAPGGAGGTAAGAGSSGAEAPAFAAAGKYTYDFSGKASSPVAPEQPISGTSTLTVEPPSGTDQRQVTSGDQQNSERVIRDGGSSLLLVHLKLSGQGAQSEFKPDPPVVLSPKPLAVGAAWAWKMTSTDGKTTLSGDFKAVRTETLDVGGTKVDCVVIDATLQYEGDASVTQKQTIWASPQLLLTVREESVTDGKFGSVTFHSETTSRLLSTTPS